MSAKTDSAASGDPVASPSQTSPSPGASSHDDRLPVPPPNNPHFALFVATAGGLGYFPKAPGTWGSLAGVAIFGLFDYFCPLDILPNSRHVTWTQAFWVATWMFPLTLLIAAVGVWASSRVAKRFGEKDPQYVVIDEVSGQHLTYVLALALGSWKYLLLGFILFRVFDIWKPFPARQAESLPGGWGIMADDWIAGVYAAIGLWLARAAGL
jgi:phosphatidylglycerophosphatase A